jgi:hypothetical protein
MIAFRIFAVLMLALPLVGCSDEESATAIGDCGSAKDWQASAQKAVNGYSLALTNYAGSKDFNGQAYAGMEYELNDAKKDLALANQAVSKNCASTQTAAATPASPSNDPNSTAQPQAPQQLANNTTAPDTPSAPATPTAAANVCTTPCAVGSFCEVQSAEAAKAMAGLGPPPQEQAATPSAGLGPPPQEQAATPSAGLGPPPQEQAATPSAGLGPPPDPAAPAPAGPSSQGNSTTAMLTPPVAVPAPPAMQPPTAGYNSGSNVCNPTPAAPPKPSNVCNPPTTATPPQNASPSGGFARVNSGQCYTIGGQTTCSDASGNSCTTSGSFCDPTAPQPISPKPNQAPLNLKPATQMASAAPNPSNQTNTPQQPSCPSGYVHWSCQNSQGTTSGCLTPQDAANDTAQYKAMGYTCSTGTPLSPNTTGQVQACSSKPPYLPWGGHGSATITVSGGQACGVGWHDTPGGPGGVTVLDSMSVSSPPSHGTLRPQDQHVIIFTPAPGYKGQDSFTLSMQEHNGGRSATLSVKVSVTIQ